MSDPVSALNGARFEGHATVTELPPQGMVTVRGDLGALQSAVNAVTGLASPGQREIVVGDGYTVGWMSPDELLILCPRTEAGALVQKLSEALEGQHHLVFDVSDMRSVFRIEGAGAREALAKLAPVDMHPDSFKPGELRRTRIAQVAAGFWIDAEGGITLVCFRSVAQYAFDLLRQASATDAQVAYF